MQPVDFEDYVHQEQHAPFETREDSIKMLDFPGDDLAICRIRREVRTIAPVVPEPG